MAFKSIEQIIKQFDLEQGTSDELIKLLKMKMAKIHPDKNGGVEFASPEDEKEYLQLGEAIEFIKKEKNINRDMIPISSFTEIVKIIKAVIPDNQSEGQIQKMSVAVDTRVKQIKQSHLIPKITLPAISGILTFVWLSPNTIANHPILSKIIDISDPIFTIVWIFSLALSISLWILFMLNENRSKNILSALNTEAFQNRLFEEFVWSLEPAGRKRGLEQKKDNITFTKENFIRFVNSEFNGNPNIIRNRLGFKKIDLGGEILQNLANIVFTRAENKGVIKKLDVVEIFDVYQISK